MKKPLQLQKQFEPSPNKYDPDAMEFEHARKLKKNHKVKRRKSLKTAEVCTTNCIILLIAYSVPRHSHAPANKK